MDPFTCFIYCVPVLPGQATDARGGAPLSKKSLVRAAQTVPALALLLMQLTCL